MLLRENQEVTEKMQLEQTDIFKSLLRRKPNNHEIFLGASGYTFYRFDTFSHGTYGIMGEWRYQAELAALPVPRPQKNGGFRK